MTEAASQPITYRQPPVQRRSGPPPKRKAPRSDGSPKVKRAIHLMIWGGDDGLPMKRQDAAKAAGLADVTLRQALSNPMVLKFYNEQLEVLRNGERPKSIHRIATLRDKAESERVQLDAAKYLDGGDKQGGINVSVNVANITPGYQVVMPSEHLGAAHQILNLAHSTRNLLTDNELVAAPSVETSK